MSYCRMGVDGSEVYAYQDIAGHCEIWHNGRVSKVPTLRDLRTYLELLVAQGIKVPQYAFEGIDNDLMEDAVSLFLDVKDGAAAVEAVMCAILKLRDSDRKLVGPVFDATAAAQIIGRHIAEAIKDVTGHPVYEGL